MVAMSCMLCRQGASCVTACLCCAGGGHAEVEAALPILDHAGCAKGVIGLQVPFPGLQA